MAADAFTSRNVGIDGLTFHYTDWGGDGLPWSCCTVCPVTLAPGTTPRNPNVSFASIPDCGHSITLDSPDGLLQVVSPWLADGLPRSASAARPSLPG